MQGSVAFNALTARQAARANDSNASKRAPIGVDRHADPFEPLFSPVTVPALLRLVLLGLAMMLLPILLPLAAGRRLFGHRRRTPVIF
jgi:hypothetical protein